MGPDASHGDIKSAQPKSSFTQVLKSQAIRNERGISHVNLAEWEAEQTAGCFQQNAELRV